MPSLGYNELILIVIYPGEFILIWLVSGSPDNKIVEPLTLSQGGLDLTFQMLVPCIYGSGHETVAVLLPGFAISW